MTEEADTRLGTIKEIIKALKHSFPRFFSSVFKCKEGNTRESSNYPLGLGGGDGVEESLSISPLTNSLEGRRRCVDFFTEPIQLKHLSLDLRYKAILSS